MTMRKTRVRVVADTRVSYHVYDRAVGLQPSRTVDELRELQELTGDEAGAQRVAWTETWERAREWLRGKLAAVPVEEEIDEAGNQWFTLRGSSERELLIGGHIDSVPNGGWLDGCLNVMGGVEVLRRLAEEGEPAVTIRLVNWADEEGARFGRSLFGSSAAAGSMADQDELRERRDAEGIALPDALAEHGVELDSAIEARTQLESAAAYLELHIEQGPVLESMELPLGVVLGTFGVERHLVTWTGQAAHAGSTPMDARRDALAGAAKLALELRHIAERAGGGAVCTSGGVVCKPGIVTSVVETAEQLLDQRHLDAGTLAAMLADAKACSERFAAEELIEVSFDRIWSIEPILFHPELIELCDEAIREVVATSHRLPSGPLHDAAEVARAGVPTVMLFVQSLRGLSHTKIEDTRAEHLELAVQALDRLASKTIAWLS
jgi:hydantoinase/carbamoylase family amidase